MRATSATCMSQTRWHFYPVRDVVVFWYTDPASSANMEDTIRLTRCFGVADASSIVDCGEQHAWRPSRAFPPGSRNHHDIIGLRPPAVFHSPVTSLSTSFFSACFLPICPYCDKPSCTCAPFIASRHTSSDDLPACGCVITASSIASYPSLSIRPA